MRSLRGMYCEHFVQYYCTTRLIQTSTSFKPMSKLTLSLLENNSFNHTWTKQANDAGLKMLSFYYNSSNAAY